MVSMRAQEKHLELGLQYPAEVPRYLVGDAGRIRQVLTNLVVNAVKFTPKGRVSVAVREQSRDARRSASGSPSRTPEAGSPRTRGICCFRNLCNWDSSLTRRMGGTGLG
jgi:signal transduction histidine kinase